MWEMAAGKDNNFALSKKWPDPYRKRPIFQRRTGIMKCAGPLSCKVPDKISKG